MKLQHLAIIFVIIILPISLVVGEYIQAQINTISMQTLYSTKLQTATYDSMKAFRINTVNNSYSTINDSKIRDIEAAIATYFNSLGRDVNKSEVSNFEMEAHTPALVYTLYDGYYIYSKYRNDKTGVYQYGLKPYVYYSCRYVHGSIDIIVNYTLDNYITIYGFDGENYITKSGNIINENKITDFKYEGKELVGLKYGGAEIKKEVLKEQIVYQDNGGIHRNEYTYAYYNNNKIYYEGNGKYFILNSNNKKQYIIDINILNELKSNTKEEKLYNNSALKYYEEAYKFTKWCKTYLSKVTQEDARDVSTGEKITDFAYNTGTNCIFDYTGGMDITDTTFDLNRISVIRRSIQSNLLTAIANFNSLSNSGFSYEMPVFSEEDWYKVVNNVSVISFMQGIPIGTKYFNDYCIITNNVNKEVVTLDSLYAITEDGEVHNINCKSILDEKKKVTKVYKNIDFERKTISFTEENRAFYYPHANTRCYNCLVNTGDSYEVDYVEGKVKSYNNETEKYEDVSVDAVALNTLRQEVLTALARERYDLYKVNDYFRGYDETLDKNYITKENTNNIEFISLSWYVNGEGRGENKATVKFKKTGGSNTLKLQFQVDEPSAGRYVTNATISDDFQWIQVEGNELTIDYNYFGIRHGSKIYLRLYDGTYDGDYMVYTILDKNPPEPTTIEIVSGTKGNEAKEGWNWYKKPEAQPEGSSVKVGITPGKDKESGFNRLEYSLAGAENIEAVERTEKMVELTIAKEGHTVIKATTYDNAAYGEYLGNSSSAIYELYKDTLLPNKPTIQCIEGSEQNGYYNGEVKVKVIYGQDKGDINVASGIDYMWYEISEDNVNNIVQSGKINDNDTISINRDGKTVLKAYMMDKAGNKSEDTVLEITGDGTPPEVNDFYASDVTTKGFKLNIKTIDTNSGIDKIEWHYRGNNVEETIYTQCNGEKTVIVKDTENSINNLESGKYYAYAKVYDMAGNVYTTNEISITTVAVAIAENAIASPTGWTNENVVVKIPKKDSLTVQYSVGNTNNWENAEYNNADNYYYTKPITENTTVYYRCTDGTNDSNLGTLNVNNIDKVAPNIFNVTTEAGYNNIKINVNFQDELSGLSTIIIKYKRPEDSEWQELRKEYKELHSEASGDTEKVTKEFELSVAKGGTVKLYVKAYDVAGNEVTYASQNSPVEITTNNYTVTYDGNAVGVTNVPDQQTKKHGEDLTLRTKKPTRTGYTFDSWNTQQDGNGKKYGSGGIYSNNASVTLYAKWTPNKVIVKYNANGGKIDKTPHEYNNNNKTYYYMLNNDGYVIRSESKDTGYTVLEGSINYNATSINLTNVSTFGITKTGYHIDGDKAYKINSKEDKAKTFSQAEVTDATELQKIKKYAEKSENQTIIMYINWIPNTYEVEYKGNGKTSGSMKNSSHTYDVAKTLTANGFSKTGYTFAGWNTKADGTGTSYKDNEEVINLTATNGATVTLYAQWKANVEYAVQKGIVNKYLCTGYNAYAGGHSNSYSEDGKAITGDNNVKYYGGTGHTNETSTSWGARVEFDNSTHDKLYIVPYINVNGTDGKPYPKITVSAGSTVIAVYGEKSIYINETNYKGTCYKKDGENKYANNAEKYKLDPIEIDISDYHNKKIKVKIEGEADANNPTGNGNWVSVGFIEIKLQ